MSRKFEHNLASQAASPLAAPNDLVDDLPATAADNNESLEPETAAEADCEETGSECPHYIVGIGASAGGLEALESFFREMPEDLGASYVVIQHLSPDFESHMDQLLGRVTNIPIQVAGNETAVKPNTIYLIPPKSEMVISGGKLLLTDRAKEKVLSHPIDQFFRSLSQDAARYSIGVVLSGTGSDGSRGIQEITRSHGLVIAQEPTTAKFDAMPLNAQETGDVHLVLPPEAMAEAISGYVHEGDTPEILRAKQLGMLEQTGLSALFRILQRAHQIDFSHYKPGTVERRIQRRIDLQNLNSLDGYIARLENDPKEVNELYKDLLIGVTRFFRDAEAFEYLRKEVLPAQLRKADQSGNPFRVWICGCATGEEAYSLAMILIELIDDMQLNIDFKIFATDAHRESLQYAATGSYPEAKLDDVSPTRRQRFFRFEGDNFLVKADVRRRIVFAPHDVVKDPPFTQMNVVSCRNLLIYLQSAAQRKVLSLFHFALRPQGTLFLGPSETIGDIADEFEPLEKHWRIYRKRRDVRLPIEMRTAARSTSKSPLSFTTTAAPQPPADSSNLMASAYDALLSKLMPPSIMVDDNFQMLHVFPGAEPFLTYPTGPVGRQTTNVLQMVYPAIRNSIAAALRQANRDGDAIRYSNMPHPNDKTKTLHLKVEPIVMRGSPLQCYLIQFDEGRLEQSTDSNRRVIEAVDVDANSISRIESLEDELNTTRQNLQSTIEELETSNEELQATNEEMLASNEELQSTNEELHSVNEELYTVNAEHQNRVTELNQANADMDNLVATTGIGVVYLDRNLTIRKFTPKIAEVLYMETGDRGKSIGAFSEKLNDPGLIKRLDNVLTNRRSEEWEVTTEGKTYLLRALPYWSGESILGIVIAFINIDSLKETEAELAQFKFMADESVDGFVILNEEAEVVYANRAMAERLGYEVEELKRLTFPKFDTKHDIADFHVMFNECREQGGLIFNSTHCARSNERISVEIAATYVELRSRPHLFCTVRDIRDRKRAERERRVLQNAIAAVENGILICDASRPELPITFANNGFYEMTGYASGEVLGKNLSMLEGEKTAPEAVEQIRKAFEDEQPCRVLIEHYRKDGSEFWNDVYITPVKEKSGGATHFVAVQNDVTERIRIGESVRENERTIRLLLDSTAEGIYGVDADGFCTFCNSSAVRMLGYGSEQDLIGRKIHAMLQPDQFEDGELFDSVKEGRVDNFLNQSFTRADGGSFPVQIWCHPIRKGETFLGAVVTFVDDSERRQTESDLQIARERADAANHAKSRFLANMSHELRTPISAILGFAKIIEEEHSEPGLIEKVETIQRNGDYLLRLLGDILDLSRIEAGRLETTESSFRLSELLVDVRETMQIRAQESKTKLTFEVKSRLPEKLETDPIRLRQVLINLIANAIKFTPEGSVTVDIQTLKIDTDEPVLQIAVKDNGIGIESGRLERLFEPFTQANANIVHRFGGTGLGLSISRRLMDALGGAINAESTEGVGSKFTVTLPVDKTSHFVDVCLKQTVNGISPADQEDASNQHLPLEGKSILVADDLRDIRFIAQHFLKKAGAAVDAAEDGAEAVKKIETSLHAGDPYDLVLMDVQMPVMDGPEAVASLRQSGIDTPIIALTADAMKGTREQLLSEGFTDYMTKPIDAKLLLRTATKLLAGGDNE